MTNRYHLRVLFALLVLLGCLSLNPGPATADTTSAQKIPAAPTDPNSCVGSWSLVSSPNWTTLNNTLYDVASYGPNEFGAVGSFDTNPPPRRLQAQRWNGTAWQLQINAFPPAGSSRWRGLDSTAPNDAWAVGEANAMPNVGHWNGSDWTITTLNLPGTTGGELKKVDVNGASPYWAVGEYYSNTRTQPLIMRYNAPNWETVSNPETAGNASLQALSIRASNDIWAVGYETTELGDQTLTERWNGNTWNVIASPNLPTGESRLKGVLALAANDVWAVGERGLLLHWNGASWARIAAPNAAAYLDIAAFAPNDIWAVGDTVIHWDGSTWTLVPVQQPSGSISTQFEGIAFNGNDGWIAGSYADVNEVRQTLTERYSPPTIGCTTPTATATRTPVVAPSATASPTATTSSTGDTPTVQATSSSRPSNTPLPTSTPAPTQTPGGATATRQPSNTPLPPSSTPTRTNTPPPTQTPGGPTATPEPSSTPCTISFTDVGSGNIFYADIQFLACRGVISGFPNGDGTFRFEPNSNTTRGQFAKIASLGFGIPTVTPTMPTFSDVAVNNIFYVNIESAFAAGVVNGLSASQCAALGRAVPCYGPNVNITRGQVAAIVQRARAYIIITPASPTFSDVGTNYFAYAAIETLASRSIINGVACPAPQSGFCFRPNDNIRRGELSKVVRRAIESQP